MQKIHVIHLFNNSGGKLDSSALASLWMVNSQHPSVATFFRTLLRHGEVEEGVENREIIQK
jgi:hypothetical protein